METKMARHKRLTNTITDGGLTPATPREPRPDAMNSRSERREKKFIEYVIRHLDRQRREIDEQNKRWLRSVGL
jgi:hypothetical protein